MNRRNIDVIYEQKGNGRYVPLSLRWGSRIYEIERVLHTCRSVDGSYTGTRYTVVIGGEEKYIYRDGEDWYVDLLQEAET